MRPDWPSPNLARYAAVRAEFSRQAARAQLDGLPGHWYTAPTAIRMMMKDCADAARQFRYPDLRFIASMG